MVVIGSLATDPTVVMQERTARPATSTVHAPQSPIPHPYLAPLRFNMSRSTHKRGISGETSTVAATLLMFNLIGIESTTVRLEEEDWHEDTLGTRVYQISMPEYHRENVRLMDLGRCESPARAGACRRTPNTRGPRQQASPGNRLRKRNSHH